MVASPTPHDGDLACNPGMCPDWESNMQPFREQADTQSTETHQAGLVYNFIIYSNNDSYVGSNSYLCTTLTICQAYTSTLTTQLRDCYHHTEHTGRFRNTG